MAKDILGIDIGYDRLKLALVNGTKVKKTVSVPMPERLLRAGRIVSQETFAELLRAAMKENGIHCRRAALVLSNESVFVRNVTMPQMNAEQLTYNLPFEFRDYITDELKNYVFDYAVISAEASLSEDEESPRKGMELMAAAAQVSLMEESREMLRKAGLKMVKAAPAVCSYIPLLREAEEDAHAPEKECCILDLGYQSIRMYIFRGDRHMVTRVLETGLSLVDEAIAEAYNVDVHLAHTYLLSNYDDCQNGKRCAEIFESAAIELMRALNFYSFNNPESSVEDIWICGGGAAIPSFRNEIAERLGARIHGPKRLVPGGENIEECYSFVQAVGITQD